MYIIGILIVIAIFTSDARGFGIHVNHEADVKDATTSTSTSSTSDQNLQHHLQQPRRFDAAEVEALKGIFLLKLGLERPPTREEVAGRGPPLTPIINSTNGGPDFRPPQMDNRGDDSVESVRHFDHHRGAKQFVSFQGKGMFIDIYGSFL